MMTEELMGMSAKVEILGESVLETLFDAYFDGKGTDIPSVDAAYRAFSHTLLDVDPFQIVEIMSAAALLCVECERAGFIAGVKTRICLDKELSE